MHVTAADEMLCGVEDRLRRGKVRFADFHVDDVAPGSFQFACPAQQFHDMERFDVAQAA
jgi:hypothetical protein